MSHAPEAGHAPEAPAELTQEQKFKRRGLPALTALAILAAVGLADCNEKDEEVGGPHTPSSEARTLQTEALTASQGYAVRDAMKLKKDMGSVAGVATLLEGRTAEFVEPRQQSHLYGEAPRADATIVVVNDGQFAYTDDFFRPGGQEGRCKRGAWQLSVEACQRLGGCADENGIVQVGDSTRVPNSIGLAQEKAFEACMGWTLPAL